MKINFFFKGKLSREEASSAFLATLLEQWPEFRRELLSLYLNDTLAEKDWKVETEKDDIDILLTSGNDYVIIENKIKSSSKSPEQLRRYYENRHDKNPECLCHCLYVGPSKTMGESEISSIKSNEQEKHNTIKWIDILDLDFMSPIPNIPDDDFVNSGISEIKKLLQQKEKLQLSGDLERASVILERVRNKLIHDYPSLDFDRKWVDKECMSVINCHSAITFGIGFIYRLNDQNIMIDSRDSSNNLVLEISISIGPSLKGYKLQQIKEWWNTIAMNDKLSVGSMTLERVKGKRGYYLRTKCSGEDEIFNYLVAAGNNVIDANLQLMEIRP
ncbi:MAG: PD-(D/E)XK nuclease family protein [Bacteroidota bacterium]